MKWHCFVASTAILSVVTGCQAERPALADAGGTPAVERLQKPDNDAVRRASFAGFLDRPPEPLATRGDEQMVAAIRATVNGVPILEQEVLSAGVGSMEEARSLPEPERSKRVRELNDKVLQILIERELVLQDVKARFSKGNGSKFLDKLKEAASKEFEHQVVRPAKQRYGIKSDEEFKNLLRAQGTSLDALRRQWERQFIYQQYLQFLVQPRLDRVGHEQIVEYYQAHPEEFQSIDSVTWQDIFILASRFPSRESAKQFAEQLRGRAAAGEDFGRLVSQYDNGTSSYQGGEGIGHRRGEIKPVEAEQYLFQMRDGEVGPLIELGNGFHIIRLVKRDYAGQMPFDEKTQGKIREKLRNEVYTQESKRVIADLRRKATIEISHGTP